MVDVDVIGFEFPQAFFQSFLEVLGAFVFVGELGGEDVAGPGDSLKALAHRLLGAVDGGGVKEVYSPVPGGADYPRGMVGAVGGKANPGESSAAKSGNGGL